MADALPTETASSLSAFFDGFRTAWRSVFAYVLFGTYIGIGALAHEFGFSIGWMLLSTLLVWAGPAQVILISALGAGAGALEVAIAVSLSGVRLLPMVVSLLPLLRDKTTPTGRLVFPAHLTAVSMWVESLRLLPQIPRPLRIPFCNGLGLGLITSAMIASALGFYLAGNLPLILAAALLFLTPLSFLMSVIGNSRLLMERVAFVIGMVTAPALAALNVGLDLLWSGLVGGTAAYFVHRVREARA
jgi:predicted branched-subunit amino acid permease